MQKCVNYGMRLTDQSKLIWYQWVTELRFFSVHVRWFWLNTSHPKVSPSIWPANAVWCLIMSAASANCRYTPKSCRCARSGEICLTDERWRREKHWDEAKAELAIGHKKRLGQKREKVAGEHICNRVWLFGWSAAEACTAAAQAETRWRLSAADQRRSVRG